MNSFEIPLDDVSMVLSNNHIFGLDFPATKPNPNFPFEPDPTIGRSSNNGVDKSPDSTIELQVGVPCESDVSHRWLDSLNDEFLPVYFVIDVDFDLPIKHDFTTYRSPKFGVDDSSLVDSTEVTYTTKDFKVDDTHIQVTMNR